MTIKHEPRLTVGPRWSLLPGCSCGWIGGATYDKGEAKRSAYGHLNYIERQRDLAIKDAAGCNPSDVPNDTGTTVCEHGKRYNDCLTCDIPLIHGSDRWGG